MRKSAHCPICKNRAEPRSENPYAPFCSERCKLIDLGNWLGEGYRIPDEEHGDASDRDERMNRARRERGRR